MARVSAQGTRPLPAMGTAGVSGLDPRRRPRTRCGSRLGRDAAASPAGLPPDPKATLRRTASVADRQYQRATLNWSARDPPLLGALERSFWPSLPGGGGAEPAVPYHPITVSGWRRL